MRVWLSRLVWPLLLPLAVAGGGYWVRLRLEGAAGDWREPLLLAPYIVLLAGLLLSLRFNRGRAFLALSVMGIVYTAIGASLPSREGDVVSRVLFAALCYAVPVNLAVLSLLDERSPMTVVGSMRFLALAAQVLAAWYVVRHEPAWLMPRLSAPPAVPLSARLTMSLCAAVTITRAVWRPTPFEGGLLGVLAAAIAAALQVDLELALTIYTMAAGLAVIVSLVQGSHNLAYRDALTNLPSRRALDEHLLSLGRHYTIAMADVDHFKRFNDTYGHDVGDDVLKMVASRLRRTRGARAFRYGGEEFTLIFRGQSVKEATPALEDVREAIAGYRLAIRSGSRPERRRQGRKLRARKPTARTGVAVTVSVGVAERNDALRVPEDVIKAADKALYRAKRKGRNCLSR